MILKVNFWRYLKTDIPGNHYLKLTNQKTLRFDIISHHADKQNYFLNFQREFNYYLLKESCQWNVQVNL